MSQGCDLPLKGNEMLHLRFYDVTTGEKVFDHLYQALSESHITVKDIPAIRKQIALDLNIDEDVLACEAN